MSTTDPRNTVLRLPTGYSALTARNISLILNLKEELLSIVYRRPFFFFSIADYKREKVR